MAEYTPGPWKPIPWKHGIFSIVAGAEEWVLAETSGPNSEANARLIAAPDLLAACESAYLRMLQLSPFNDFRFHSNTQLAMLRSAIAAAHGKSDEDVQNEFEAKSGQS
jgi:hypothetical protein